MSKKRPNISGATRIVGIIGDPVAHTRSPEMHNAAFHHLGLDYVYVPFHVPARRLREAIDGFRALGLTGLNVTVPHKERVLRLVDVATPRARLAGAVNTLYRRGPKLVGDNTDGIGFVRALTEAGYRPRSSSAIVVGAGGAARAVVAALLDAGSARVRVVNRSAARRNALRRHFDGAGLPVETASLKALTRESYVADADLIVNATSLGLESSRFPALAFASTPRDCVFYDLIYGVRTDFLRRAGRAHRATVDGSGMLLHQGAAAFRLWTGRHPPREVMARVLRK